MTELPTQKSYDSDEMHEADNHDADSQGDFISPDYEFDQFDTELAAQEVWDEDYDVESDKAPGIGAISPTAIVEEDFEAELRCTASQEVTVQEALNVEYRDIARLGVIQVAGDDRLGRKVIVLSACRLPTYSKVDYQRLYDYIRKTLEQYVANDYSLVYFHHGLTSDNRPPLRWLIQAYRGFDRNFKKNLKALYIVHPTSFVLFVIKVFRPIISRKFGQKINFINQLSELSSDMHLNQLPVPQRVRLHDAGVVRSKGLDALTTPYSNYRASLSSQVSRSLHTSAAASPAAVIVGPHHIFGVSLEFIKKNNNGDPIPPFIKDAVRYMRINCIGTEGIFRRCPNANLVKSAQSIINNGGTVRLESFGDPHVAAVLIKTFLRDLEEPILTYANYDSITSLHNLSWEAKIESAREIISTRLPEDNYVVLKYLISFLTEVSAHSSQNRMTDVNLGIVFGPNLLWSQFASIFTFTDVGQVTSFVQLLISNYDDIFVK